MLNLNREFSEINSPLNNIDSINLLDNSRPCIDISQQGADGKPYWTFSRSGNYMANIRTLSNLTDYFVMPLDAGIDISQPLVYDWNKWLIYHNDKNAVQVFDINTKDIRIGDTLTFSFEYISDVSCEVSPTFVLQRKASDEAQRHKLASIVLSPSASWTRVSITFKAPYSCKDLYQRDDIYNLSFRIAFDFGGYYTGTATSTSVRNVALKYGESSNYSYSPDDVTYLLNEYIEGLL